VLSKRPLKTDGGTERGDVQLMDDALVPDDGEQSRAHRRCGDGREDEEPEEARDIRVRRGRDLWDGVRPRRSRCCGWSSRHDRRGAGENEVPSEEMVDVAGEASEVDPNFLLSFSCQVSSDFVRSMSSTIQPDCIHHFM
jgi:hypothetical protein